MSNPTTTPPASGAAPSWTTRLADLDWRRYIIYIAFVLVFLLFAVTLADSGFLSRNNLLNILRPTATITVVGREPEQNR